MSVEKKSVRVAVAREQDFEGRLVGLHACAGVWDFNLVRCLGWRVGL